MKTMKKVLALVLGLCMLASLVSVSAFAADYEPTYSVDFFNGSSGHGFLRTKVDYDNDGEKEDYYIAYGLNGYYTSTDGIKWDMRDQIEDLRSLAYGNDVGIALLASGSETARRFGDDLNSASTVYNKLYGDDSTWIELHPNIYFDELSGLFFCHGFEYETKGDYNDIGLYYTDGTVTPMTKGETTVNALTWKEVQNDFFYNGGTDKIGTAATFKYEKFGIKGDANGNILVSYHGQIATAAYSGTSPKTMYSFIKTTENKTIAASSASINNSRYIKNAPNAFLQDGKAVFLGYHSSKGSSYTIASITNNEAVKAATFRAYHADQTFTGMFNNGNTVYIRQGADLYQTTLSGTTLAALATNEDGSFKSITADIYTTLGISATKVQDMLFLDDGNIVLMVNSTTDAKAYLILLETGADGAITATKLSADATYTHFTGTGSSTDTTARGYLLDAGFRSFSIPADKGYASGKEAGFTATISGTGSQYFEGSTKAYPTVSAAAPAGQYTINYFLTINNQPSIFATKTATFNVVPRFTTSVNDAAAADEAYRVDLSAGANTVTVTFDDLKRYVTSSSANYDDTLETKFLVMGARYNSSHQMQEVVEVYNDENTKLTEGSTTPFEFNVTNAAEGDYLKVFILDGFTKLISLW